MDLIPLANTGDIAEDSAKAFELSQFEPPMELFVVHQQQRFFAYLNRCPHTGVNLNWWPDQFFDVEHEYIQCATHGALFKVENGYCVRGPCAGASLQPMSIVIQDNTIYLDATCHDALKNAPN
ncbi:Rieske (2Fe-2S) protein [Kaarinaea lacus]